MKPPGAVRLRAIPLTRDRANKLVADLHRHHKPVTGYRFAVGAYADGRIVGAAIVGRPVARACDQQMTCEVTRCVTDGTPNACSFLYGVAARIAREWGFTKIQTYLLDSEPGTTLRAAGWELEARTKGGDWNHSAKYAGKRRTDQPMVPKQRWAKKLNEPLAIPEAPDIAPANEPAQLELEAA